MKTVCAAVLGDRELTTAEVELITQLRSKANEIGELLAQFEHHVTEQHEYAQTARDIEEMERLSSAEPFKWLDSAKQSLQVGIMHAARALAQPTQF